MAKKIAIAALVLIVALGAAFYYFYSNSGAIIKSAVEHYGSEATRTAVRLSSVELSVSSGEGSLQGLRVGNPAGYSGGNAIALDSIDVAIDSQSVLGTGPIVIREVNVNAPAILYENKLGKSNLDVIRDNVRSYAEAMSRGGGGSGGGTASQGRKIIIDNLYVRGGTVQVSDAMLKGAGVSAALPTIHLSNIGRAKGGATQAEVTQQILTAVTGSAIKVGASALTKQLGNIGGVVGAVPGGEGVSNTVKGLFGR